MSYVKNLSVFPKLTAALFIGATCFLSQSALAEDEPSLGSYESYIKAVDAICYASAVTDGKNPPPWNTPVGNLPKDIITISRNNYPDIYDPASNQKFKDGIKAIKGDDQELSGQIALESQNLPLGSQIEKASLLYKERMNSIYACAVLNAKYKIHTRLVKEFKPEGTNIVRNLQKATQQIDALMKQKSCINISKSEGEGSELSVKRSLIRSSTLEYCNYRHYLNYVDYNVKNSLSRVITAEEKSRNKPASASGELDRFPNSEAIATALVDINSRATNEIAHTQQVFDDAFDSYREFEQNYASHILMILIEDRYLVIREYVRDTMNPIGQVIYKALNAESPGK